MVRKNTPQVIIICGQTATGKSALAIDVGLSLHEQGITAEVISADSRQVYEGLDVCSNKVTVQEMQGVTHHTMSIVPLEHRFTVAQFQEQARELIDAIINRGNVAILCGGTGLYIDAVMYDSFKLGEEVRGSIDYTGKLYYQNCIWIGLHDSRGILVPRIEHRARDHYDSVISEVSSLLDSGTSRDWLYRLGLEPRLAIDVIEGRTIHEGYITELTVKTWQYAKRQMTWFKRNPNIQWFLSNQKEAAKSFILERLTK